MIKGYCRVSSRKQLEGYGLDAQKTEILSKYPDVEIYEEQYTGTTSDRPVFNALMDSLESGDTLVVSKLDRLARNTVEGIQTVEGLFKRGISVHILNVGLLEDTPMGKFFLTTLLAVAEMERATIIERTQSGKEQAKLDPNFKDGRPKKHSKEQREMALQLLLSGESYSKVEKKTGISKSTLQRLKREHSREA
ncbi:recombinase family protein [Romboutsia lituseburensis]|uniref:recombinase family protein n=1 Tax=Romboutsia lituseburensis TaxID=1537 RepID=UPI00215A5A71|nr:recombinase family protein [Romboutsia lituseburensis]MCR8745234.1 recombinase family protein [Romboutsia lituseburensis]